MLFPKIAKKAPSAKRLAAVTATDSGLPPATRQPEWALLHYFRCFRPIPQSVWDILDYFVAKGIILDNRGSLIAVETVGADPAASAVVSLIEFRCKGLPVPIDRSVSDRQKKVDES